MPDSVLPSVSEQLQETYKEYLRQCIAAPSPQQYPSSAKVDDLRAQLPADEGDLICYEVEVELGVGTVHPKKGN